MILAKFVLGFAVGFLCFLQTNGSDKLSQLTYEIFDVSSPVLTADELLEKLKALDAILSLSEFGELASIMEPIVQKVKSLIEIDSLSADPKCDQLRGVSIYGNVLEEFDDDDLSYGQLGDDVAEDQKCNAYRYVIEHRDKRFKYCADLIEGLVQGGLAKVDAEDEAKLAALKRHIDNNQKSGQASIGAGLAWLAAASFDYLSQEFKPEFDRVRGNILKTTGGAGGEGSFAEFFKQKIIDPCQLLKANLRDPYESYRAVRNYVTVGKETEFWLSITGSCNYMISMSKDHEQNVLDIIKASSNK